MHRPLTISQRGLLVVIFLVATEVVFVAILAAQMFSLQASLKRQHQERTIVTHITRLISANMRMNSGTLREQFLTFRDDKKMKSSLRMYLVPLDRELDALRELVKGSPGEQRDYDAIQEAKQLYIANTKHYHSQGVGISREEADQSQDLRALISYRTRKLLSHYDVDVESAKKTKENLDRIKLLLLLGFLASSVTVGLAGWYFWKQIAGRLDEVTDNVARFANGEPLVEVGEGDDEISAVDALFRRLGNELATAAEQERSFFQNSIDVICSLDSRGVFMEVSPSCEEQWGYSPDELLGASVATVLQTSAVPSVFLEELDDVSQDAKFEVEDKVTKKDGTTVNALWSAHWSAANGSFFCFVRDASESKRLEVLLVEQEKQIRELIDNLPVGILTIGGDSRILTANKTAVGFIGGDRCKPGESLDSVLKPLGGDGPSISSALSGKNDSSPIRCDLITADGDKRFVDLSLGQQHGQDERMVVLFEDATERVRLEQLKSDYVNLLGQRLRDPLAKVRGVIASQRWAGINSPEPNSPELQTPEPQSSQRQSPQEQKQQQRIERSVSNIDRLLTLIDELLHVEKLAAGKLVDELAPCAVTSVVEAAVNSIRDHAELQKLSVSHDRSYAMILADEQRLVQVVINLLSNAIKYSPAGTNISVEQRDLGGDVEIRVIDQGRGLPAHMHERIFESYVQVQKSDADRGTGTGLGLAICKQIVEKHGGRIGVESEEGKGSSFWIRLPKLDSDAGGGQ